MNKCLFCPNEDEANEVEEECDICDDCVKRGLKEGWLKE